jgi:hypothetical protein
MCSLIFIILVICDTIHTYLVIRIPGPALAEVFIVILFLFMGGPPTYILVHTSSYTPSVLGYPRPAEKFNVNTEQVTSVLEVHCQKDRKARNG